MDITIICNHPGITGATVNTGVFLDKDPDILYLSNPLDKPVPLSFFKPEAIELTFEGEPVESLELAPKTLVSLSVEDGEIFVKQLAEGAVKSIPLVPPTTLNAAAFWTFSTDIKFFTDKALTKKFGYKQMKDLYAAELLRIQTKLL